MDATLNLLESSDVATLKTAVIYDDHRSGCRAKAYFDQLTTHLGAEIQFSLALWRMDVLELPGAASAALRDFGCADLLVLALRDEAALPVPLLEWVESWARSRVDRDSALVVLCASSERPSSMSANPSQLRQISERWGLRFFCERVSEAARKPHTVFDLLHRRAQAFTPTLQQIMEYSKHEDRSHWATNFESGARGATRSHPEVQLQPT